MIHYKYNIIGKIATFTTVKYLLSVSIKNVSAANYWEGGGMPPRPPPPPSSYATVQYYCFDNILYYILRKIFHTNLNNFYLYTNKFNYLR